MAQKVTPKLDESLPIRPISPAVVQIKTQRGAFSKRVDFPLGSLENPISWEELADKFRDCVSYATKPLIKGNVEKVIELIHNIEDVHDVSQIPRLLVGG